MPPSYSASLDRQRAERKIDRRCLLRVSALARRAPADKSRSGEQWTQPLGYHNVIVHRFKEVIGGRAYHIEVTPVSNRWRAQLQRSPGVPTAMMPFYGQTPDEAARQLTNWLTLAHRRQTAAPVTAPKMA